MLIAIEVNGSSVDTSPASLISLKETGLGEDFIRTVVSQQKTESQIAQQSRSKPRVVQISFVS
jgi:hypothetical protein